MWLSRRARRHREREKDTWCAVVAQAQAEDVIRHVESQDAEVDAAVGRLTERVPNNHFTLAMRQAMGEIEEDE